MGDCGAYAYVDQDVPPVGVEEILDFYERCGCDYVLSVDHVVPGFISRRQGSGGRSPSKDWRNRQQISLDRARTFLRIHRERGHSSVPIGIAQGWDVNSYTSAVVDLQKMGYRYIALGGLASLSTHDIAATVEEVSSHLRNGVRIHLLGVSRDDLFGKLKDWGVTSFDSTMPVRQAFMDDKHNYHTTGEDYLAIRVPKVKSSSQLQRRVNKGEVSATEAFKCERESIRAIRRFDERTISLDRALEKIRRYEMLFNGRDQVDKYRETLQDRAWERCECSVCRNIGVEVIMLRGRERNKRRGFHNMRVLYEKVADARH
jgi:tRNA-guanine family transglycosylase